MLVKAVVALGNEQIARQRGFIAMLEMRGQKATSARQTVRTLEARQWERLVVGTAEATPLDTTTQSTLVISA